MPIITLTTDLGLKDGTVAMMKGVIYSINPAAQIVDISHLIEPQNIFEAAGVISYAAATFPTDTVHIIVVDPGVGTSRRPIAAQIGFQLFVCPDNGVLSFLLHFAEKNNLPIELVHITNSNYWLPTVSDVFHGRDIFAPVAAHITLGINLNELGLPISDPEKIKMPTSHFTEKGIAGEVVYIDNFGNIVTNIFLDNEKKKREIVVKLSGIIVNGLSNTFGDQEPGTLISLIGGTDTLIVSMVNGNAAKAIGAKTGDSIDLEFCSPGIVTL